MHCLGGSCCKSTCYPRKMFSVGRGGFEGGMEGGADWELNWKEWNGNWKGWEMKIGGGGGG